MARKMKIVGKTMKVFIRLPKAPDSEYEYYVQQLIEALGCFNYMKLINKTTGKNIIDNIRSIYVQPSFIIENPEERGLLITVSSSIHAKRYANIDVDYNSMIVGNALDEYVLGDLAKEIVEQAKNW